MRLRFGLLAGVALALAGLSTAGGGVAKTSQQPVMSASFLLRGSHGYQLEVDAIRRLHLHAGGRRPGQAQVFVHAFKDGRGSSAAATYRTRGLLTAKTLKANLGKFGRIDMRIHREPGEPPVPKRRFCFITVGVVAARFNGQVRFRGEHGFTRASAARARGDFGHGHISCSSGHPTHDITFLVARDRPLFFSAVRFRLANRGAIALGALTHNEAGRVRVSRTVVARGGPGAFRYNAALTRARVRARGPFLSGSARFRRERRWRQSRWTGSLSASFPGEPSVLLTGPDFRTRLRQR